jgi:hypothetical protein
MFVVRLPPPPAERAARVHNGMTRAEVLWAVGEPPDHYTRAWKTWDSGTGPRHQYARWTWDDGALRVWFDDDDRVQSVSFQPNPNPPSLLRRWRLRLGL